MQPRCRNRVPVCYSTSIRSYIGAGEGVLLDLSPAGCRMRSSIALNAGTYLALRIAVTQEPTPLAVEVSVIRWCRDGHFGVEFLRYSHGDRERVTNLVATLPSTEMPTHPAHPTSSLSAIDA
ncbi:MAG: PilZ domain-containing protein [Nitrospirota bacterium]